MRIPLDVANRPSPDLLLVEIAAYVMDYTVDSKEAYDTARNCLMDSIGCGLMALKFPECTKHLGPLVPDTTVKNGARVFGCTVEMDPVKAAWDIGAMIRWLDFNDTWLAAEWGHPSDNLGAIIALADYISRVNIARGKAPFSLKDVLTYMIKAHEIQGVLALENSFNRVGLDHVLLVRVASTAIATHMLGGTREQIINAISQAWVDGAALRTYRQAPNTGSRKSWAAGDATSRAVRLAMISIAGEMGIPSVLTAPLWGFNEVSFKGRSLQLKQGFGTYVMEHILFKISFPAEFHAQTAVECAVQLHPQIKDRLEAIERIEVHTQESALRIISKTGTLHNAADRDHCLQYMIAVGLIEGNLEAQHYEDQYHQNTPLIEQLRDRMLVFENKQYTRDYLDPQKRSIANALQIFFKDGTFTDRLAIEYPVGHRRRRKEGIPLLEAKFKKAIEDTYTDGRTSKIMELCCDQQALDRLSVPEFMSLFVAD